MIVYHGTTLELNKPDVLFSKQYLDFGKGFYVTSFQAQAENWAYRKHIRQNKSAVVNMYELKDEYKNFKVLSFNNEDESWFDFVQECRNGADCNKAYDLIIGRVADDDVFKTLDLYFRGIWTKEQAISELRYYNSNDQICIVTQKAVDELLTFKGSYQVVK